MSCCYDVNMHENSKLLFQKYALEYFRTSKRVLEIGPDSFPSTYKEIVSNESIVWDTLDLYEDDRLTYSAESAYTFPISENSYDIVLSGNVIEHVRKVWIWMKEVSRVCKADGLVITINPVSWPYHQAPIDCWRAYPEGMKALYEDSSLEVLVSTWESLEQVNSMRRLPGRSAEWQSKRLRFAYGVLGFLGFPVECAFDTITIGRKVQQHTRSSPTTGHKVGTVC